MRLRTSVSLMLCAATAQSGLAQTSLPDLGAGGAAQALNDRGHVVGVVYDSNSYLPLPARWDNGRLTLLGTGAFGEAQPLNVSREGRFVAGKGGDVFITPAGTPVLWDETGALRVLPDLGFGGIATGVDDLGVAVGIVYAADQSSRAARWSANGQLELLPVVNASELVSGALEINSSGHIAGFSYTEPFYEAAVRWDSQGPTLLDQAAWNAGRAVAIAESSTVLYLSTSRFTLGQTWYTQRPDGARTVIQPLNSSLHFTAEDVNSAENVVGYGSVPDNVDPIRIRAAIWIQGQPWVLPVPNENTYSMAYGVNEAGAVAGVLLDNTTAMTRPVTWAPIRGAGFRPAAIPVSTSPIDPPMQSGSDYKAAPVSNRK